MKIDNEKWVAVVIPSFRVKSHILDILAKIPVMVRQIYVVDDACPDGSGKFVVENCSDPRVKVLFHNCNQGVGGAVMTGYRAAVEDGMQVIVKVDGDGQMAPELIPIFVQPILEGEADYTKGNRFYDLEGIRVMPRARLFGNAILSLLCKLSSGYWNIFDPTNGYTAIHASVVSHLPFGKISQRYFFETDMLFRLNTLRAVVVDVPMEAVYRNEISNLKISKIIGEFFLKHIRNFIKRVFYNYYLRDMSLASIELPLGIVMVIFGLSYGGYHWVEAFRIGISTPTGTVMLAAISLLMGMQFIMAFIGYDIASMPTRPIHKVFYKQRINA